MLNKLKKFHKSLSGNSLKVRKVQPILFGRTNINGIPAIKDKKIYLAAVIIVKDEADYLEEWIEFHLMMGVEKILVYDNASQDRTTEILKDYERQGVVEMIPWPNFLAGANHQHLAYVHACIYLEDKARWLAFLDADEFFFSPSGENIADILKEMENYPAIGVFLKCFGPSGHDSKPEGLVIENYSMRLPDTEWENRQIKSIVQPEMIKNVISASRFRNIVSNVSAFAESGDEILSYVGKKHVSSRLRINHYATKSLEELEEKVARSYFWRKENDQKKRNVKIEQHSKLINANIHDRKIMYYVPLLKEKLAAH